ncbi:hypothetical protein MLD38_032699 [Melastoma candidum]|uniref:Uncharacterized protein n=1 Tax=Melastoma candidum TaxID=119954 RepID=A0ACB9M837_9MYRT|nr:hypothetical protein MLD38_032699 [Melastoma candidum]
MDPRLYDFSPDELVSNPSADCTRPFTASLPDPDVHVLTSGGLRIPAYSSVLASASPVLENAIDRPRKLRRRSERVVPILGVPCGAVSAFIGFIYSSRCHEEQLEKYSIHLLALSHVYLVPQLKHRCTKSLGRRLTEENVVDVLQLARLCDAPDLYLTCMKLVYANFNSVEKTEAWKFLQDHDPWLELQILQFIDEAEMRKKNIKRHKEELSLYQQLSEAMDCLQHVFSEGCTIVGPLDMNPPRREACSNFVTCQGVQLLIKHFTKCDKRANNDNGGCPRCKRMWQLLRLHSLICDQADCCRVPLCRQFKLKSHQEKRKKDETRWKLLVKKVRSAQVMSSLSHPKRKRADRSIATD